MDNVLYGQATKRGRSIATMQHHQWKEAVVDFEPFAEKLLHSTSSPSLPPYGLELKEYRRIDPSNHHGWRLNFFDAQAAQARKYGLVHFHYQINRIFGSSRLEPASNKHSERRERREQHHHNITASRIIFCLQAWQLSSPSSRARHLPCHFS